MIRFSLVLLLLSILLYWLGALSPFVLICLLLTAAVSLSYELVRTIREERILRKEKTEKRAKWAAGLMHIYGLQLLPGQHVHMFITRQDEIAIKGSEYSCTLPLSDVRFILVTRYHQLRHYRDEDLRRVLGEDIPSLDALRSLIRRSSRFSRQMILLLILEPEALRNTEENLFIALQAERGSFALRSLISRPEIRLKTRTELSGFRRHPKITRSPEDTKSEVKA